MRRRTTLLIVAASAMLLLAACGDASANDDDGSAASSDSVATLADPVEDQPPADENTGTAAQVTTDEATEDGTDADGSDSAGEDSVEFADDEAQLIAFAECMRDQGIEMDDPTVDADGNVQLPRPTGATGPGSIPDGIFEARDACAEFLVGIELGFAGGGADPERQDQLLEFTSCMRDNGFDMPDIDLADQRGALATMQTIDQDDPAWTAAFDVCGDILAGFGPGTGGR